jgi:hypothetical protein
MRMAASIRGIMVLLLVLVVWPAVGRSAPGLNEFAYGFRMAVPDRKDLVRLDLPTDVYRHLVNTDGGDIRVFSMGGDPVPHVLRRPAREGDGTGNQKPLPFYPLYRSSDKTGRYDVRIRTDASGAVLSLSSPADPANREPATAYLVDTRELGDGLQSLTLAWQRHQADVLVKARLEASNDLERWELVSDKVILADIRSGSHRLQNRTIAMPGAQPPAAYLRLSWLEGGDAITVNGVTGAPLPSARLPKRYWIRARYRSDLARPGHMQFNSGGAFPVDRIDLHLPQGNSLLAGTIKSRATEQAVWRVHSQRAFYNLNVKDTALRNDPLPIPETTDRFWMLDIDNRQSGLGGSVPRLMLGGRPHELFFAPRGGGMYILAFGSRNVRGLKPPDDLAREVALNGSRALEIHLGQRIDLGGTSRLKGRSTGGSGQMLSLSTWLLGCVLLVAFFAWWVVRRMLRP